ncbi:hypothetical protein GWK18_09760 [Kocuria sp. JC486]|uniref:hypothetical protein n=1 Tax=Kocuria sp. JC486 TaxID=1970736 RepID=UPI0014238C7A|nr:hypothetical protein [Kocuria sp. JC486]NHU85869.1 hypothetical protein [Kocuria sp. JC486]
MGFFSEHIAARRDEKELGRGAWRRAHDRFRRGLDRFHQVLEQFQDPAVLDAVVPVANELADLLPRMRGLCSRLQTLAPAETEDIPPSEGGWLHDVHRELSRAGNDLAQAAEALAMARFHGQGTATDSSQRPDAARLRLDAIARRAAAVAERVDRAEQLFTLHDS